MAIKLPCPRCKKALAVPNKKAGGYVQCPSCSGRLWVPNDAPADSAQVEAVTAQTQGSAAGPQSPIPSSQSPIPIPQTLPPAATASTIAKVLTPPGGGTPPPPPPPPPVGAGYRLAPAAQSVALQPTAAQPAAVQATAAQSPLASVAWQQPAAVAAPTKTARFISAEAAQSRLQLAADGKLPELHLRESDARPKKEEKERGLHPAIVFGAVALSIVSVVVMLSIDAGGPSSEQAKSEEEAWSVIEGEYFGDLDVKARPERYQELLRDAQRAHNRGDYKARRKLLREVLEMLKAEPNPNDRGRGLTGSKARDKKLEKQIAILLR